MSPLDITEHQNYTSITRVTTQLRLICGL